METNNKQKVIKLKAKMFEVIKLNYKALNNLINQIQEQDRLALCFILDYFDDLKTQIKTIKKEYKNYGI